MKIALFTETFLPKVDGIVTRLTKTIEFLIKNGDEVIIFCPEGCPESYMGATVVGVAAMPLPLYLIPRVEAWFARSCGIRSVRKI